MYVYKNKVESGGNTIVDLWAAYRGKYPDPTAVEYKMIERYLSKFAWEDDDFIEDKYQCWISLKNRLQCPNLRDLLIQLVRQIRFSKGYDVDLYFDFIPPSWTVFIPRSLDDKKFYDEAMAAAKFAIGEINTHTMMAYEVVSVDKMVSSSYKTWLVTPNPPIITNVLLLTFTTKAAMEQQDTSFQAMMVVPTFLLKEWKFKPL